MVSSGGGDVASNTALGSSSLNSNTTGANNTAIGQQALQANTTASNNTAVGYQAAYSNTTSTNNTAVGYQAGYSGTTSGNNTYVGKAAGYSNTAFDNTFVGFESGYANTTGTNNTAIGLYSLQGNTTGSGVTGLGRSALVANTTGANNTAVGYLALASNTTGASNTALGYTAGNVISTGNNNVCIGYAAGSYSTPLTTGGQNVFVGTNTGPSSATVDYEMVIACLNSVGKGGSTGYINPQGGGMYQGNNTTTWATVSDRRLKKNIVDNNTGLDVINQIRIRNFEYRLEDEITELNKNNVIKKSGIQLGVIAQEIAEVSNEFVKEESTGVISVNSDNLTWYLINAVKELNAKVEAQALEIATLKGN